MSNKKNTENKTDITPIGDNKSKKFSNVLPATDDDEIVISGMAGKFPNCHNIAEYEHCLYNKIDMVDDDERRWRHFSAEIPKRAGKIYDLEKFDASFFGVHFKQAHTMDPQTRILIETAYEAAIDAGINPKTLHGTRTGVYVGCCTSDSAKTWFYEKVPPAGLGITGCSHAMMANHISYSLGLHGPSQVVDTACSSSMYALDCAVRAIRNGQIDAAIVGGANLILHPFPTLQFARLGLLAANGLCRPFDNKASGYTRSEAINCLFVQRKRDAKRVYASVFYLKTNCDGYKPEGITYPSRKVQAKLLNEIYGEIDITPNDLGYLEAHSTGTVVGDLQECSAIDSALCSRRTSPLLVGSVKSNAGHSEAASGICSLVKACLALETGKIAPNINFDEVRTKISALAEGRLVVVKDIMDLEKPYIGVNSFGFGGTNAHAVLKAFHKTKVNNGLPADDIPRLVTWAGRSAESVNVILDNIAQRPLDAEFIGLLQTIQKEDASGMSFRGFGVFSKNGREPAIAESRNVLRYSAVRRPIVWVFSGLGSQWSQMGLSLMIIPQFRKSIERCQAALLSKGLDLLRILTCDDPTTFDNVLYSFVGIAAIQIGLVDVLRSLNLRPDYIIGHSVGGELGCGYADGGFTAEQMILASYYCGKASLDTETVKGSMAAVGVGFRKIASILPETIEVACHNGADSCTVSGPAADVAQFVAELKTQGIFAQEFPCSNIAYHSSYISNMVPQLLKYLQQTIVSAKSRSSKWLSSSVPKTEWDQPGNNLGSAEYHTNNLLNRVLFEETLALLPNDALIIEIAPDALLQTILKQTMPNGLYVPLMQRDHKNNVIFLMTSLGKLFCNGSTFPVENLYPTIEFPVSRGTAGLSSLIRWDHSENWFVMTYGNMTAKSSGERIYTVNLASDEEIVGGNVIDGKALIPATCYLQYVWETFSLMYHGPSFVEVPVQFEDVKFLRSINMPSNGNVQLNVMIHYGTGNFEITVSGALVVTGRIVEMERPTIPKVHSFMDNSDYPMMSKKDFYKELRLRGYHYNGSFRSVKEARGDGLHGRVEWKYNWVTFMDAMLQVLILGTGSCSLLQPTKIQKLRIYGLHHLDTMSKMDPENQVFDVYVEHQYSRIIAGGIEIMGVQARPFERSPPPGRSVLEKYQFLPHIPTPALGMADAVRTCVQIALENTPMSKVKIVEVDCDDRPALMPNFVESVADMPIVTGDFVLLSNQACAAFKHPSMHIFDGKLSTQGFCHFIVVGGLRGHGNEATLKAASKSLTENGYLVVRERTACNIDSLVIPENFTMIAVIPLDTNDEVLLLLQNRAAKKSSHEPLLIHVSESDTEFKWITQVQQAIANKLASVLYAYNEKQTGLIGLVKNMVTCFLVDDASAPPFSLTESFYERQYALGQAFNVYRHGAWGTYRHLQLNRDEQPRGRKDHVFANILHREDLSTLHWCAGPLDATLAEIRIVYASINFSDVMLATCRRAPIELCGGSSRLAHQYVLGSEYSGFNTRTGRRIMGMVVKDAIGSHVDKPSRLIWDVPSHWSLQEAATVPVVYTTIYYAFFMATDIRKGKSILIHAGAGDIGLAAIRTALAYKLDVYTTCSSPHKKTFLLDTFPQLKGSHIGNSRDTSFEAMIHHATEGKGVDFVLNSLTEDKLLASVRCLGTGGHFLEIGTFDTDNDSKLDMSCFLKEMAFHAVLADRWLTASDEEIVHVRKLIDTDITNGTIQPLPATVFPAHHIEQAFRHLVDGNHVGKVVVQVREGQDSEFTMPIKVLPQVYFKPCLSYIIPGGLGGFGLELTDWMVMRGAKKIILNSRKGVTNDYQLYRLALWKTYGCEVHVSTQVITTLEGCSQLLDAAEALAPVGGIFNLAVVLSDAIFENQTKLKFQESFGPKVLGTQFLDQLSRRHCPKLEHFVVFSSFTCGRGYVGLTNYGMANSIMERIIENRIQCGYPGKAIQWGAVGEVGIVADMAKDDMIDVEIGGTLPQRISLCLQKLDTLFSAPDAIVASMVVAEKRSGQSGKRESILETVMNVMSIRCLKSVSWQTTLAEMGMDSLLAAEIKHILERDFELVLTQQNLRSLTFRHLKEFDNDRECGNSGTVSDCQQHDSDKLLCHLGDDSQCDETILPIGKVTSKLVTPLC